MLSSVNRKSSTSLSYLTAGAKLPTYDSSTVTTEQGATTTSIELKSGERREILLTPDVDILEAFKFVGIKVTNTSLPAAAVSGVNAILQINTYTTPLDTTPGVKVTSYSSKLPVLGELDGSDNILSTFTLNQGLALDAASLGLLVASKYNSTGGNYDRKATLPLTLEVHNTSVNSITLSIESIHDSSPAKHIYTAPATLTTAAVTSAESGLLADGTLGGVLTSIGLSAGNLTLTNDAVVIDETAGTLGISSTITGADLTSLTEEEQDTLRDGIIAYYAAQLGVPESSIGVVLSQGSIKYDLVVTGVTPFETPAINAASVSMVTDGGNVVVADGTPLQATATVLPVDASNHSVSWTSSDTGVLIVSADGLITAVGSGSATVTVTTVDGGFTATEDIWSDFAPSVNAGSDQDTTVGATVTLSTVGTVDPDGDTITYSWTQTAGGSVVLGGTNSAPTFTAPDSIVPLEFDLSVSDGTFTVTDSVVVTITDATPIPVNNPPVISAITGSVGVVEGAGSSLTVAVTDVDVTDVLTYAWSITSGSNITLVNSTTDTVSYVAVTPALGANTEDITFSVTVSDGNGGTATLTKVVTITSAAAANTIPTVSAGQSITAHVDTTIVMSYTALDADNHDLTYQWNQLTGTSVSIGNDTTNSAYFTAPSSPETLTFELVVSDPYSSVTSSATTVTIEAAPVTNTMPSVKPDEETLEMQGMVVTLDAQVTDTESPNDLTYAWTQTSGLSIALSSSSVELPEFTMPAFSAVPGEQPIVMELLVTDLQGASNTYVNTIYTVDDNAQPLPLADASNTVLSVTTGNVATLSAMFSRFAGSSYDALNPDYISNMTILWEVVSGYAAVTLSATDEASPTFTVPTMPGVDTDLVFRLTVSDSTDAAKVTSTLVTLVATAAIIPPVAVITQGDGPLSLNDTSTGTLNATVPAGNISYAWTQVTDSGSSITLNTGVNTATLGYTSASANGTSTITLTVTDTDTNAFATDTIVVNTVVSLTDPTAVITSANKLNYNEVLAVSGTGSSDAEDNATITYLWSIIATSVGANGATISTPTANSVTLTGGTVDENLILQLVVTDIGGHTNTTTQAMYVRLDKTLNIAPLAGFTTSFQPMMGIVADSSGTIDPEGTTLTYSWTITSTPAGTDPATATGGLQNPTSPIVTLPVGGPAGLYEFTLIVSDGTDTTTVIDVETMQ